MSALPQVVPHADVPQGFQGSLYVSVLHPAPAILKKEAKMNIISIF